MPWSTVLSLTTVPPLALVKAALTISMPFLGKGSDALLPTVTVPPVEVRLPPLVVPLEQAARKAATLL